VDDAGGRAGMGGGVVSTQASDRQDEGGWLRGGKAGSKGFEPR